MLIGNSFPKNDSFQYDTLGVWIAAVSMGPFAVESVPVKKRGPSSAFCDLRPR